MKGGSWTGRLARLILLGALLALWGLVLYATREPGGALAGGAAAPASAVPPPSASGASAPR